MKTYRDISDMANADYSIGLEAHYNPLANLITERSFEHIVEVGTAYGGNAYHLLTTTDIESLICIDPYIFYPAMPGFTCQEEYDTLYEFATNRLSFHKGCKILRKSSKEAFTKLLMYPPVDLVFLDGNHEYRDVIWECENYKLIIRPGGILSGHDYNIFEGVNNAVDEFSRDIGKPVQQRPGNKWYIEF